MQLHEMKRAKNSAFNWSDEELLGDMDDVSDIIYKDKYTKRKPKAKTAYSQIKSSVRRGYTQAKETINGTASSAASNSKNEHSNPASNYSGPKPVASDPLGGQKT